MGTDRPFRASHGNWLDTPRSQSLALPGLLPFPDLGRPVSNRGPFIPPARLALYLLQALLQLLQRCRQPLVLSPQLGDQVHAVRLPLLLVSPGQRPAGPTQQCTLLLQPADLELELIHLGPRPWSAQEGTHKVTH